jgi:hypothetical protein
MSNIFSNRAIDLDKLRQTVRGYGLSRPEADRLATDAIRFMADAVAAGIPEDEVRCLITTNRKGSVALFVGDLLSCLEAIAAREQRKRPGTPIH